MCLPTIYLKLLILLFAICYLQFAIVITIIVILKVNIIIYVVVYVVIYPLIWSAQASACKWAMLIC